MIRRRWKRRLTRSLACVLTLSGVSSCFMPSVPPGYQLTCPDFSCPSGYTCQSGCCVPPGGVPTCGCLPIGSTCAATGSQDVYHYAEICRGNTTNAGVGQCSPTCAGVACPTGTTCPSGYNFCVCTDPASGNDTCISPMTCGVGGCGVAASTCTTPGGTTECSTGFDCVQFNDGDYCAKACTSSSDCPIVGSTCGSLSHCAFASCTTPFATCTMGAIQGYCLPYYESGATAYYFCSDVGTAAPGEHCNPIADRSDPPSAICGAGYDCDYDTNLGYYTCAALCDSRGTALSCPSGTSCQERLDSSMLGVGYGWCH